MARTTQTLDVEGRSLTVSNLEKPLYPSGFTKGQVIDYYIRVADYILPHLARRPVTLKRYPDGVRAQAFYEKDAPRWKPAWVHTTPVPRRTGEADIQYIVVDDLPSLVWCANAAALELHPFLHRAPELETPTSVVFDLDPGEGAHVLICAQVAFLLKAKLESVGLEAFPKVSGSKGIQVYVPLNTAVTYAATQPFARGLAEELEREHPTLIVSRMAKALRKNKVFIDWSQNSDFKTTVGVYSLRAKRDRPYVSMPVTWDELRAKDPARLDFDPDAAIARLTKLGDLFAPVLSLKQKLPRSAASARARTAPAKQVAPTRSRPSRQGSWKRVAPKS